MEGAASIVGLYALPPALLLVLAIAIAVIAACGGQLLFRRLTSSEIALVDNDIAGFLVAIVGTLYAVMLGFMAVEVWDHYDAARLRVSSEAASSLDVWHDAVALPVSIRTHLRNDMVVYAKTMIEKEWPAMRAGGFSPEGDTLVMDATTANGTFVPRNAAESNGQMAIIEHLNQMHDLRASRMAANAAAISSFQWLILAIGGIVVIGFCWLFGAQHVRTHLLMTGAIVVIIAAMFVLIFELQSPFRSQAGISAEAWNAMLQHVDTMDATPGAMSMQAMSQAPAPSTVVQHFYDRYLAHTPPTTLAGAYFTPDFAREYRWVMGAQKCLVRKTIIDYDPFFGSQVKNIGAVAGDATIDGAVATVAVKTTMALTTRPFPGRMTVALRRAGDWKISNFIDKDGNSFRKALALDIAAYRHGGDWKWLTAGERSCISALP